MAWASNTSGTLASSGSLTRASGSRWRVNLTLTRSFSHRATFEMKYTQLDCVHSASSWTRSTLACASAKSPSSTRKSISLAFGVMCIIVTRPYPDNIHIRHYTENRYFKAGGIGSRSDICKIGHADDFVIRNAPHRSFLKERARMAPDRATWRNPFDRYSRSHRVRRRLRLRQSRQIMPPASSTVFDIECVGFGRSCSPWAHAQTSIS